ncbi:hypothetical protein AVENLUH5627_02472 [Acinetobacter venetianus]|uniref:Uncharacterized protein n=1 Tax=Acinetobacter venetianus TaxID=52133 RepID=A0A150HMV7_9GAMM|nr:hypothetical protein [Acinetobacter venetianus]KXZ66778.1 hypothetical protein AVENLUH5627_02472 [Acinetobacter venetianus]
MTFIFSCIAVIAALSIDSDKDANTNIVLAIVAVGFAISAAYIKVNFK